MIDRDRIKQVRAAVLLVAVVSLMGVLLVLRWERAAMLFSSGEISTPGFSTYDEPPLNNGCPRGDRPTRKDVTLHFYREMPWSAFDGQITVTDRRDGRRDVLFRGPYQQTITLQGVCYDSESSELVLGVTLVARHHEYRFDADETLPLARRSKAEITFTVDSRMERTGAWLDVVR